MQCKTTILLLFIFISIAFSSDWSNSVTFGFANKIGNTNINSFNGSIASSNAGDFKLFGKLLTDSEFSALLNHAKEINDTSLVENNGVITLIFDYHANQTFSPFVFAGWSYDSLAGLDSRANLGLGAKYRFTEYSSFSTAILIENQTYTGEKSELLNRISLRPKYKRLFNNGSSITFILFYQPSIKDFNDYLLKSELSASFLTGINWLSFTFKGVYDYNNKPPVNIKNADLDLSFGITISF